MGQDHGVAVTVGHEHRSIESAQPLQERMIWNRPGTIRVVLLVTDLCVSLATLVMPSLNRPSESFVRGTS
jgi:hypothetical protein